MIDLTKQQTVFVRMGWDQDGEKHPVPIEKWKFPTVKTQEDIDAHFAKYKDAGIGVVTGKESNITVIDFDSKDNPLFSQLFEACPTYWVTTRKGFHLYYRYTDRLKQGVARFGEGVDVRNDGGIIFCPPTKNYEGSTDEIAELNDDAKALLERAYTPGSGKVLPDKELPNTTTRNDSLFRKACGWINVYEPQEVWNRMVAANKAFKKGELDDEELESLYQQVLLYKENPTPVAAPTKDSPLDTPAKRRAYYEERSEVDFLAEHPTLRQDSAGQWYEYQDGVYRRRLDDRMRSDILTFLGKKGLHAFKTKKHAGDKLACLAALVSDRDFNPDEDQDIINVKNGLYSISTRRLYPHTPEYVSITQIETEYDETALCPRWEQFIDEVTTGKKDQGRLLQQFAGYAITRDTSYQKAFMFDGDGSNGKSVFAKVMKKLLQGSCSNVSLEQINEPFGAAELHGKTLNIIEEIKESYYHSDTLKRFISGEPASVSVKYRSNLSFTPSAKFLFCVNQVPRISDTSTGSYRRFIIVPFKAKFGMGGTPADPGLFARLLTELPGILNWALKGLADLRGAGGFIETDINHEAMESYMYENSPLREMIRDLFIAKEGARIGREQFYEMYKAFVQNHGGKPRGLQSMIRELRMFGYEVVQSRAVRGYREYEVLGLESTKQIFDNRYSPKVF